MSGVWQWLLPAEICSAGMWQWLLPTEICSAGMWQWVLPAKICSAGCDGDCCRLKSVPQVCDSDVTIPLPGRLSIGSVRCMLISEKQFQSSVSGATLPTVLLLQTQTFRFPTYQQLEICGKSRTDRWWTVSTPLFWWSAHEFWVYVSTVNNVTPSYFKDRWIMTLRSRKITQNLQPSLISLVVSVDVKHHVYLL